MNKEMRMNIANEISLYLKRNGIVFDEVEFNGITFKILLNKEIIFSFKFNLDYTEIIIDRSMESTNYITNLRGMEVLGNFARLILNHGILDLRSIIKKDYLK